MAFNPTNEQKQAIEAKGNVLVSAAAGSGKTAVLVERVISRLTDGVSPVSADRLLIVTFTNAAAAEMRSRIEKRLDGECRKHPDDIGLMRQKRLLGSAKICTIDSFCIDLVRENFEKAGVAPDFKLSDGNSLKAVNEEVLSKLIFEYFEKGDKAFFDLLDVVGAEYDDGNFSDFVLKLYEYSRQLAEPEKWFAELGKLYDPDVFGTGNIWHDYAVGRVKKAAGDLRRAVSAAVDILCCDEKAADTYIPSFKQASEMLFELENAALSGKWDEIYERLIAFALPSLPRANGLSGSAAAKSAKQAWSCVQKDIESLCKIFFADSAEIRKQHKKLYASVQLLSEFLCEFEKRLFDEYVKRNTFTFHNTEHLALRLLQNESQDGELLSRYDEVMVDEYQDTNNLQDTLFYILSGRGERLFAVGDVKQSIYGFRGADPSNFLEKKNRAVIADNAKEGEAKKIILGKNFRCKPEVCNYVNFFFGELMTEKTGSICYDEEEMLVPAAKYPSSDMPAVEFDIIGCKENSDGALRAEAGQIAKIIKEMMAAGRCIRQDDETLREACFSDFTVLLRSTKHKSAIMASELKKYGIPVNFAVEGYAESREVSAFLSLLKIIDNPESDVELLTVLLSPIFALTEDEVAQIRVKRRSGSLYSALVFSAENGNEKHTEILKKLEKFRLLSVTLPLPRLITCLLNETDYLNTVAFLQDGECRRGNLLLLVSYAEQYSSDTAGSIGGFVKYIKKQSESGLRGATAFSGGDTVKIMSIHASKGLQFPVCIVADTASQFNDGESRTQTLFSSEMGIGFKYYDDEQSVKLSTVAREVILDSTRRHADEEELRLLYVAMTRTQDRLIFTGCVKDAEKTVSELLPLVELYGGKADGLFHRARSYFKWLALTSLTHPDGFELRGSGSNLIPNATGSKIKIKLFSTDDENESENDEELGVSAEPDWELTEKIKRNIGYAYPYEPLFAVEAKSSVSAIANKAESEKYAFTAKPSFMSDGGITAAERGTATHKIMEFIDFSGADRLDEEIDRLYEWQFITEREAKAVDRAKIKAFFESEVFGRIKRSHLVKREMRFLTELPARAVEPKLDRRFDSEFVMVQGAVDLCFEEDDGIVVLDFKTDRTDSADALVEAYGGQLEIYACACQKIFGKRVKQKIIYSFALSKEITV